MTDRTCPGYHGGQAAPPLHGGYLCRSCLHRAERILGELPSLAREVEVTVSKQDRMSAGRAGIGREQPLPVNLDAGERARHPDVLGLLFEWADHVAAWHRVPGLPVFAAQLPMSVTVPRAVAVLLGHADWMRHNQQGPELAQALGCIRRDLRRIIDRPPARTYAGPCRAKITEIVQVPVAGGPASTVSVTRHTRCKLALYRYWGAEEIVCDGHLDPQGREGCGARHAAFDRREFLVDQVRQQLLPLRLVWESLYVLLPGCQVDWATAQRWTRSQKVRDESGSRVRVHIVAPRLEAAKWDGTTALYRGSDILRLAEDKAPRRGRRRNARQTGVNHSQTGVETGHAGVDVGAIA